MNPAAPELSVVVVGTGGEPIHAGLFDALAPDLARGTVEVIDVRDDPARADPRARCCLAPAHSTVPRMRALGLAAARGRWVALTESFCEPAAGWAAALRRCLAEQRGAAVGGPVDRRGGRATDWASTFCEYGRFLPGSAAGPVDDLPGINVAYDLARVRRALGGLPEEIYEYELHARLRASGEILWQEPAAMLYDASHPRLGAAMRSQRHHGRLHGSRRAAEVSIAERLLRCGATPLVPALLFARTARVARSRERGKAFLRASFCLALLLCAWALGEGQGYLAGAGAAESAWT